MLLPYGVRIIEIIDRLGDLALNTRRYGRKRDLVLLGEIRITPALNNAVLDLRPAARRVDKRYDRKQRKVEEAVFLRIDGGKVYDVTLERPSRDGHFGKPRLGVREQICRYGVALVLPKAADHAAGIGVILDVSLPAVDRGKRKTVFSVGVKPRDKAGRFAFVVVLFEVEVARRKSAEVLTVRHAYDRYRFRHVVETVCHVHERAAALFENVKRRRAFELHRAFVGYAALIHDGPAGRRYALNDLQNGFRAGIIADRERFFPFVKVDLTLDLRALAAAVDRLNKIVDRRVGVAVFLYACFFLYERIFSVPNGHCENQLVQAGGKFFDVIIVLVERNAAGGGVKREHKPRLPSNICRIIFDRHRVRGRDRVLAGDELREFRPRNGGGGVRAVLRDLSVDAVKDEHVARRDRSEGRAAQRVGRGARADRGREARVRERHCRLTEYLPVRGYCFAHKRVPACPGERILALDFYLARAFADEDFRAAALDGHVIEKAVVGDIKLRRAEKRAVELRPLQRYLAARRPRENDRERDLPHAEDAFQKVPGRAVDPLERFVFDRGFSDAVIQQGRALVGVERHAVYEEAAHSEVVHLCHFLPCKLLAHAPRGRAGDLASVKRQRDDDRRVGRFPRCGEVV